MKAKKTALNHAFADLRAQGFLARQNFSCCSSCGGYDMATKAERLKDQGKEVKGCVFYHAQDEESREKGRNFYVSFGNLNTDKHGVIGIDSEEVGQAVLDTLIKYGINATWSGKETDRVCIVQREEETVGV